MDSDLLIQLLKMPSLDPEMAQSGWTTSSALEMRQLLWTVHILVSTCTTANTERTQESCAPVSAVELAVSYNELKSGVWSLVEEVAVM